MAMLMMKFICSNWIKEQVTFIETKITKMLDFEFSRHVKIENRSPFVDMIMRFKDLKQVIRGPELLKMTTLLDSKMVEERKRVRAVKADNENYKDSKFGEKIELEILQLDKVYQETLKETRPDQNTQGLTPFEYICMC